MAIEQKSDKTKSVITGNENATRQLTKNKHIFLIFLIKLINLEYIPTNNNNNKK